MAHHLADLNVKGVVIQQLTIHSVGMSGYIAEVDVAGRNEFITGNDNRPSRFTSVVQVRQQLWRAQIKSTLLVHQSAYDEMIGLGKKTANSLVLKL